ncbi:MAG: hypothetical protein Q4B60_00155 [Erysipelotrichaceae bacterium]|nr:hypothetical protein [Erysipelotrichaceae bacterium]
MDKIKRTLLYGGLDKETFNKHKDCITENDIRHLTIYLLIAGTGFGLLWMASLVTNGFAHTNALVYLVTSVLFFIQFICLKISIKKCGINNPVNTAYVYTFATILYFESIYLTTLHPSMPAVTYIGILLMIPLLFAQVPFVTIICQTIFVIIFCICVSIFKYPEIAYIDIWNSFTFLIVSVLTMSL